MPLHLMLAASRGMMALATPPPSSPASPSWSSAWPSSSARRPELVRETARIGAALSAGGHQPEEFREAVLKRLLKSDRQLVKGLAAYRRHPLMRELPPQPAIWAEGASRLLDYAPGSPGPVVLVVPSLVNKAHVLDLLPEASFLRWLAAQGLRPLLLDWGWPGPEERHFTLTDYIAGRLERALMAVPGPVVLAGYCMGGVLTLAAALRRPDRVRALALLATPWDFHAEDPRRAQALASLLPGLEAALAFQGALPVEAIQTLFAMQDPYGVAEKFRAFARLDPESPRARLFVALEDWLNDGIPLPAPVARECLSGWYGQNLTARGAWRVAGLAVDPRALRMPCFLAIPDRDRIVPPASALALAGLIHGALAHRAPAGHIGMVAGSNAEAALWQPLLRWLKARHL